MTNLEKEAIKLLAILWTRLKDASDELEKLGDKDNAKTMLEATRKIDEFLEKTRKR